MAKSKSGRRAASRSPKRSGSKALAKRKLDPVETKRIEKELAALAASIVKRSEESQKLCVSMTQSLIETGRELAEARELNLSRGVKGEGFALWVEKECAFGRSTAYNYLRLFEYSKTHSKKLTTASVADAYVLAGIKHAAASETAEPAPNTKDPFLRGLDVGPITPSDNGKTRALSLTRDDGFSLNLQLPADKLEDYVKKGRGFLLKHVREALDKFLKDWKSQSKNAKSDNPRRRTKSK